MDIESTLGLSSENLGGETEQALRDRELQRHLHINL